MTLLNSLLAAAALIFALAFVAATTSEASPSDQACWGQASMTFAQTGEMGEHASGHPTPRLGLRNLARSLHDQGVIEDDSLRALGQFVSSELGLEVEACR
jgi:hypothetical protein